jgi:hypothetical protein
MPRSNFDPVADVAALARVRGLLAQRGGHSTIRDITTDLRGNGHDINLTECAQWLDGNLNGPIVGIVASDNGQVAGG